MTAVESRHDNAVETEEVTDKILTLPNIITFARLSLVPCYLVALFNNQNLVATLLFALAASTDFVDGQIARRTHQVSKLGQLLDPAVDRILMITGVLGVFAVGRVPLWVILIVVGRDLYMLYGGCVLLFKYKTRVPVFYAGKVATTLLFIGFGGLLLNMPLVPGLGWCEFSWLPGFNHEPVSWGIWFVYVGMIISVITMFFYVKAAAVARDKALAEREA
ncbi:MAG: CDP-alcohol phosphatidyltransferase family protein [Eggerthellaceae bacterium]|nr:CDP-alcohol phosphatidyltransferase family protein [Eggerthellaceae bacterium]